MLSNETLKLACDLMINLAEHEKMVEINRQILGQNLNFDAYQLFAYLDTESKNYINEINIINFLQKRNGIPCSIEEIQFLVFFYDENFDGKLSYTEFLNFVLTDNNYSLRKRTRERVGSCYGKSIIPFIVEYSFVKLLQKELNLIRSTSTIIAELKSKNDFNVHVLFHYIKGYGCITSQSIKLFLQRNLINFEEDDIRFIIKRIDIDRDSKINFCEFHAFFCFPNLKCICCSPCNYSCHKLNNNKNMNIPTLNKSISNATNIKNNYNDIDFKINNSNSKLKIRVSPERTNKINNIKRAQSSNNLNINLINNNDISQKDSTLLSPSLQIVPSIKRIFGPNKNYNDINNKINKNTMNNIKNKTTNGFCDSPLNNITNESNKDKLNNSSNYLNNNNTRNNNSCFLEKKKKCDFCNNYPCFCSNKEFKISEINFLKYIYKLIEIESNIEEAKINLLMRSDFNVEDAFRIFENPENENISFSDLQKGLKQLGIFASLKEIKLLMKRVDIKKKGFIDYSDFFDLLVPFQKKYRDNVERRIPSSFIPIYNKNDIFLLSTKIYFTNLFRLIISCEDQLNIIKENIVEDKIQIEKIFNKIDNIGLGYISDIELYIYLKNNGIIYNELQNSLAFIRLDKNRDGKIELWEIEEELCTS